MVSGRLRSIAKFLIPSAVGVALFMIPVQRANGDQTMLSGLLVDWITGLAGSMLVPALVVLTVVSTVVTVWHKVRPIRFISEREGLDAIFTVSTFWLGVRIAGATLMVMVLTGAGPAVLTSDDTGGNILYSIIPAAAPWYLVGGLFLPFLTDYGLVDLFSALFQRFAKPIFRVPGNSMVDCLSSWLGSSVCGAYLTISQYEKGFYTGRETAALLSGFELLSISFCSMIASMMGVGHVFGAFYATIVIAGLVCAFILPRIHPILGIADEYCPGVEKQIDEEAPEGMSSLQWGCNQALKRADGALALGPMLLQGAQSALNLLVSTLPSIMTFGSIALIVATQTSVFDYLGIPLGLYLSLFGVPDAMEVGSTILVGFADQFVPVILGSGMASTGVRFLVGAVSILQILYMTDIGSLILTSKVPFKFWQIFVVYLERVVICIPIVILCAHLFGVM